MSESVKILAINIKTFFDWKWIKGLDSWLNQVNKTSNSFSEKISVIATKFTVMSESIWLIKDKVNWFFSNAIDEADKLNNAMVWLESIAKWTWKNFDEAKKFIQNFTADWLVWTQDAATSLKNLLSSWYWMKEAWQIMERLKDSAAFWRQGSLELWEAIKWATEWIKNENSVLVDIAWVTKNLSVMWE